MIVPKTNILKNVIQNRELITETLLREMIVKPRPPPKLLHKRERLKTPWDFFKSVFKDYKPDKPALMNECFEFDWECSKIEKVVKLPEDVFKIKAFLKSKYKYL